MKNGLWVISDGDMSNVLEVCCFYICEIYRMRRAEIIPIVYEEDNFQEDNQI